MLNLLRKSRTAPPAPDGLVDGLPLGLSLYPERPAQKKGLFGIGAKKIAGGIACSLLASMIINMASLKGYALTAISAVELACSAVNRVCGDPLGGLKEKLGFGRDKSPPNLVIHPKTPEQAEAERQAERAELVAEAEALGLSWRDDWPNEKLKVVVREGRDQKKKAEAEAIEAERERQREANRQRIARDKAEAEEKAREAQRAEEASERAELVAHATSLNFGVDATLPLGELRRQVRAKDAQVAANEAFQRRHRQWEQAMASYTDRVENGKNAVCPNCRTWTHISPYADAVKAVMCRSCRYITSRSAFRAGFNPPPPPVEPLPPEGAAKESGGGLLSGLTGGFQ